MKKKIIIGINFVVIILITTAILKGLVLLTHWEEIGKVSDGIMYINDDTFKENNIGMLNGDWSFYPNAFLVPQKTIAYTGDNGLISVPDIWNGKKFGASTMKNTGYGTYQLKLVNTGKSQDIMFYFTSSPTEAYKVFIDDEQVFEVGKVGKSKENTKSEYRTQVVKCNLEKELILTIHVANFTFDTGGYYKPIIIGKPNDVMKMKTFNFSKDVFVLGVLTMFLLYFSMIWVRNRHNGRAIACFIFISILSIMYVITNNEMLIRTFLPNLPFRIYNIMFYMITIAGGSIYIYLLDDLFPKEVNKYLKRIITVKAVVLVIINILFERHVIGSLAIYNNMLAMLEFLYGVYILAKAVYKKREDVVAILLGTTVLIAAIVYDALYLYAVIITPYGLITPFALAIFILFFAVIVARRYEKSYQQVENLSTQLIEMDKIKDQFLANTSHELRTPVSIMTAVTQGLLEQKILLDEEQRESLNIVVSSGKRLKQLINDLLDYSSMKYGKMKLVKSMFNIRLTIRNTLQELQPAICKKNLVLSYEVEDGIEEIYGDKYRFIQVVYNLVQNAIKFTPEYGKIDVKVYKRENVCCIAIKDTGIGISKQKIGNIFNSFEQANVEIGEKYGGLGLGLSICREIIFAHNGQINVESNEGSGTIFTIEMPIVNFSEKKYEDDLKISDGQLYEEIEKLNIDTVESKNNGSLNIKGELDDVIVVIDDSYSNVFAACSILKVEGYSIKGYVNAQEGLKEIMRNPNVVLAIIDLMMPKMSGDELCSKIRSKYNLLQLPILILTARLQTGSLVKSFQAGANDFLNKPFQAEELRARVKNLAQLRRMQETAIENELRMLQAQINPHFLYNTLNSIAACCYENGEMAADIIVDLSDYLRYRFTFESQAKEIPLSKELELVKVYLAIEKIRFDDKLTYEFDFKDEMFITIPPFSLQTLVENAVKHGIRKKREGGKVTIRGYKKDSNYIIEVRDTGIGMLPKTLENVLEGKESSGTGLGIMNVKQRLKRMYGTELKIYSVYEQGTTVTIVLRDLQD